MLIHSGLHKNFSGTSGSQMEKFNKSVSTGQGLSQEKKNGGITKTEAELITVIPMEMPNQLDLANFNYLPGDQ